MRSFHIKLVIKNKIVGTILHTSSMTTGKKPVDTGVGLKQRGSTVQERIEAVWTDAIEAAKTGDIAAVLDALYPDNKQIFDEVRITT